MREHGGIRGAVWIRYRCTDQGHLHHHVAGELKPCPPGGRTCASAHRATFILCTGAVVELRLAMGNSLLLEEVTQA